MYLGYQCDQIFWNFATSVFFLKFFGTFLKIYLAFAKINVLWQVVYAIGQIFFVANGQTWIK